MGETAMNTQTVLVVEDNNEIAFLIRFLLEREGFVVERAADGRTAAQLIATMSPPKMAVLDIMLPYVDGMQLLVQIRGHKEWGQVPVLMLSAKSQEREIVLAFEAGANDYMVKPFQPNEFIARVRRHCA